MFGDPVGRVCTQHKVVMPDTDGSAPLCPEGRHKCYKWYVMNLRTGEVMHVGTAGHLEREPRVPARPLAGRQIRLTSVSRRSLA